MINLRPLIGSTSTGQTATKIPSPAPRRSGRTQAARAIDVPPLRGASPSEIAGRARNVTTAYLMDRSGSMYGAWGDPSDICGAAAESLISLQRRSGGGKALVIPWGTTAPSDLVVGPIPVDRGNQRKLSTALREHTSLGGNDLPAALRRTHEKVPRPGPDEKLITFVLTDGVESVTAEMHSAIAELPSGSVHMCLIDRMGWCTDTMLADWKTVAFASVTRLDHLDVTAMTSQLVAVYADALDLTAPTLKTATIRI